MSAAIRAFAMAAAVGLEFSVEAVPQQRVVVRVRLEKDAAAMTAIAAGRSAAGYKFLAAKRHAAVPAVPSLYVDFGFIDKHRVPIFDNLEFKEYDTAGLNCTPGLPPAGPDACATNRKIKKRPEPVGTPLEFEIRLIL
jgi:hypothetical protein